MSFLLIFIDGIGIGENQSGKNPFAKFASPYFQHFKERPHFQHFKERPPNGVPYDGLVAATDTRMGVPGLPQSATGQTALLTGINSALQLGRHLPGFPTKSLQAILSEHSIFLQLERLGLAGTFANAFSPEYFERKDRRVSATTRSLQASAFPFRMIEQELLEGRAVSHDLTNEFLKSLGFDVPIWTSEEAAKNLARVVAETDFCLFEFFRTDMIGHAQDMDGAGHELQKLHQFLDVLLASLDLNVDTVLLTSDHGNFEDLSVATHTTNPAPTMIWGAGAETLQPAVSRIENITPAIIDYLAKTHLSDHVIDFA